MKHVGHPVGALRARLSGLLRIPVVLGAVTAAVVAGLAFAPAPASAASSASLNFVWSATSPSLGELVVTTASADFEGELVLTGAVFTASGATTASSVHGGDRLAIAADTPASGSTTIAVEASGEFTSAVDGSTATAWATSIVSRQLPFTPVVSAVAPAPLSIGGHATGTISVTAPAPGWPNRVDGAPARIRASGVLYGPLDPGAAPGAVSGSVVAATVSVLLTGAATYPFSTIGTVSEPGRYAWVWTISRAAQGGGACGCVLPSGYRAETVPVELTLATPAQPGAPVADPASGDSAEEPATTISSLPASAPEAQPALAETGPSPALAPTGTLLLVGGLALLLLARCRRPRFAVH